MHTAINEIETIKVMLPLLSEPALHETKDFIQFLLEKQKKHKTFVDRVLKAEKELDTVTCNSAEEFIQAIENAEDDG